MCWPCSRFAEKEKSRKRKTVRRIRDGGIKNEESRLNRENENQHKKKEAINYDSLLISENFIERLRLYFLFGDKLFQPFGSNRFGPFDRIPQCTVPRQ
jgi:hypothetical protein